MCVRVHGRTWGKKGIREERGARVGMLVTQGFRDTFDIGQEQRYDLYDLRLQFAEPLVPRALRAVHKRLTTPLDPARAVLEGAATIVQENDLSINDIT